jgi:hypothetical protein
MVNHIATIVWAMLGGFGVCCAQANLPQLTAERRVDARSYERSPAWHRW